MNQPGFGGPASCRAPGTPAEPQPPDYSSMPCFEAIAFGLAIVCNRHWQRRLRSDRTVEPFLLRLTRPTGLEHKGDRAAMLRRGNAGIVRRAIYLRDDLVGVRHRHKQAQHLCECHA